MPCSATQATLREVFATWGMPGRIRVDNGSPWGSTGGLPTDLGLWLAGLGVPLRHNPPRRPQDNGVIERSQGTGKRWSDPRSVASVAELQAAIELMDRIQREAYPYRKGASRTATHPGLEHSGRAYIAADEPARWDIQGVYDLLTRYVVPRRRARGR